MSVSYRKRGHIGIVTLSRPKARNAWGPDFNAGIARHFAAMENDEVKSVGPATQLASPDSSYLIRAASELAPLNFDTLPRQLSALEIPASLL